MQRCVFMSRECNIDARGKFVRLVGGSISLFLGVIAAGLLMIDLVPSNWFTVHQPLVCSQVAPLASMKVGQVGV